MTTPQVPDMERFKAQVRQDWTHAAANWRRWKAQQEVQGRAATEAIIEAAQIRPGMQVLDLASGTGDPALTIAQVVGPSGHVTATDLVPEMLSTAQETARQRGLTNISFQQADAEALPFPDQTFDVVTCRFGVMFFPNVGQALRGVHRVLKPGGRAALLAWGPLEQNPYFSIAVGVLRKYLQLPPPEPEAPHPFRFAPAGALSAVMKEAGLQQVVEVFKAIPLPWPGPAEQVWEIFHEGALMRQHWDRLAPQQRKIVADEVIAATPRAWPGCALGSGLRR